MLFSFSVREILGDTSVLVDNTIDQLLKWDSYEHLNQDQDLTATEWGKMPTIYIQLYSVM